jgi:hypothetical protein
VPVVGVVLGDAAWTEAAGNTTSDPVELVHETIALLTVHASQ